MLTKQAFIKILEDFIAFVKSDSCVMPPGAMEEIASVIHGIVNTERELSTDEAIRYLNVSRRKFYEEIKGDLVGIKRPGQKSILYTVKELERYKDIMRGR